MKLHSQTGLDIAAVFIAILLLAVMWWIHYDDLVHKAEKQKSFSVENSRARQ